MSTLLRDVIVIVADMLINEDIDSYIFVRCSRSLSEKFKEGLLVPEEGLAFVSRVTDLLELLLEYRCGLVV